MAQTHFSGPLTVAGTIDAGSRLVWATDTATGGSADTTSIRTANIQVNTGLTWAKAGSTGGTATSAGITAGAPITGTGLVASGGTLTVGTTYVYLAAAAPAAGGHVVGEIVFNQTPTAGGTLGWICTTAGTPGTWKAMGTIEA